ncbi:MAG: hypothetical protein AAB393_12015 [Bacteroidota bacterium]
MKDCNEEILVVNPGSTSTKMGLFSGENEVCTEVVRHDAAMLRMYHGVWAQFHFRMQEVRLWANVHARQPVAAVGMGGLLKPVSGGTYIVNERMLEDARSNIQGEHASNLGCAMASTLAQEYRCRAFVVDPVSVDEFELLARYSGHPMFHRKSLSHALNIHAAAHRAPPACRRPAAHGHCHRTGAERDFLVAGHHRSPKRAW